MTKATVQYIQLSVVCSTAPCLVFLVAETQSLYITGGLDSPGTGTENPRHRELGANRTSSGVPESAAAGVPYRHAHGCAHGHHADLFSGASGNPQAEQSRRPCFATTTGLCWPEWS